MRATGRDKLNVSSFNLYRIRMLPLLALGGVVLSGLLKQIPELEIIKISILTLILTTASVFFIQLQEEDLYHHKITNMILIVGYLLPLFLILLPAEPHIYCFWMLGGLAVAMLVDAKLGLLYVFNHTFLLSLLLSLRPETIIYYLVMGILMCLLASALKSKTTIIYAAIIILSTNITLGFVLNNFFFDFRLGFHYLSSFFSIFAVLVTAFFIYYIYEHFSHRAITMEEVSLAGENRNHYGDENKPSEALPNTQESSLSEGLLPTESIKVSELAASELLEEIEPCPETEPEHVYQNRGARTSYDLLIADYNGLLDKMKEYSEPLYQHSLQIADLSARAAEVINADTTLSRAGGLYHEVGKIQGKDYILEGQRIAEEYNFPKPLKAILCQHNIKYEKPSSLEAAIVMLSDNVVSTIEYIKKTKDMKYTTDRIIDNLFQLRMEKGTFDESGLSVKDFKILKEFYQNEFRN